MRYHYKKPDLYFSMYGEIYFCDHPLYDRCTLYKIADKGLAVIQQRFDPQNKTTWWEEIDPWLTDEIYLHQGFRTYFEMMSGKEMTGFYPTVTVRQIMWALKMKPLPKERWETVFDRKKL